jgi:hypothetical protein
MKGWEHILQRNERADRYTVFKFLRIRLTESLSHPSQDLF